MCAVQQLVEQRRKLVGDKVRITNRLSGALEQYFPQALPSRDRSADPGDQGCRRTDR